MKKSLTVFVCSTYSDLAEERAAVLDAIRTLQHQHDSMEFFGARTSSPIDTCLEEVRQSDVLVVIVGHRYGSFVPKGSISFSEAEYAEGYRLRKPCLVYFRSDDVPILPKYVEHDPEKLRLLEQFKGKLRERHTIANFSDKHNLSLHVAADLSQTAQALENASRDKRKIQLTELVFHDEINMLLDDVLKKGVSENLILSTIRKTIASLLKTEGLRQPLVFLSYSHEDKEIVRAISSELREKGIDIWIDEEGLRTGDNIISEVSKNIDSADFLAVFISKKSRESYWGRTEVNIAMSRRLSERGGPVILPILLDDVEVPALLRDVMYLDLRDRIVSKGVELLASAIRSHMEKS